jgi:hypothetical protein
MMGIPKNRIPPRQEITDEIEKQLTPVFSDYFPSSNQYLLYQKYKELFFQQNLRITEFLENHLDFCRNFETGINNSQVLGNPVTQALFLDAITYLLETELMGTVYIDRVLLLLIGKGVDFHLEPDFDHRYTRHAKSLEDLQSLSLSLSIKLDFLKANQVTLFSKWIDRNLRNKIAHLDYIIENDCFYIKKEGKKTKVDFREKLQLFAEYHNGLTSFFQKQESRINNK